MRAAIGANRRQRRGSSHLDQGFAAGDSAFNPWQQALDAFDQLPRAHVPHSQPDDRGAFAGGDDPDRKILILADVDGAGFDGESSKCAAVGVGRKTF